MIIKQRQGIEWGEVGGTFMYGTRVTYHSYQHVSLYNPLLTSGEILRSWFSSLNYQGARTQVSLPLLKREQDYQMCMNFDCQPEQGLYIKIRFFDRYETVIEEKVEKVKQFMFTYPQEAYTYEVSLLSAGFESLDFYDFYIEEMNRD
ncbi:accessory Sec system protein Asp3 [Streptococcus mitis]|uniref:Accessory Sec system protein Asp3 n=1 Tax=Streptococcus mitis TaxID=28037 RepID=A0A081PWK2_STRMT|nr:accessory Sec system protein Asp3 [Streptococcus mitis]KEQ35075.1 accessory Sec system protein Asp3 [Streptococcus mitis]